MIAEMYTRDGNSFYYIDGEWVLVDGEWFDKMRGLQRESIVFPQPADVPVIGSFDDLPTLVDIKLIQWRAKRYGYMIRGNSFIKLSFMCESGKIPFALNRVEFYERGY